MNTLNSPILNPGKVEENYGIRKQIGSGNFSVVKEGVSKKKGQYRSGNQIH